MRAPDIDSAPRSRTPAHVLHRRDAPDTSIDAAHRIDASAMEYAVYRAIRDAGPAGIISDEVRESFGPDYSYSTITARYRALLDKGLIFDSGLRRPGSSGRSQRVLVADVHVRGLQLALALPGAKP